MSCIASSKPAFKDRRVAGPFRSGSVTVSGLGRGVLENRPAVRFATQGAVQKPLMPKGVEHNLTPWIYGRVSQCKNL
jgi:hypothetical protein